MLPDEDNKLTISRNSNLISDHIDDAINSKEFIYSNILIQNEINYIQPVEDNYQNRGKVSFDNLDDCNDIETINSPACAEQKIDSEPIIILIANNISNEQLNTVNRNIIVTHWNRFLDKYHNKTYLNNTIFTEIVIDLKKVISICRAGAASSVCLKISIKNYMLQRFSSFLADAKNYWITIDKKQYLLSVVIKKYSGEYSYSNFTFNPSGIVESDELNLFTGYDIKADASNILICQPILDHILHIWANDDSELYEYILDWLASVICGNKNGTVLVLYSKLQGAGKNCITDFISRKVIGEKYSAEAEDIDQLVSKFNMQFANKLLVIVGEASNIDSNYHKIFNRMKNLITNERATIESKGVNPVILPDYRNFIITTNNECPVKIEMNDRRYTLIKINESRAGDTNYFTNLSKYLKGEYANKAASGFLHILMTRKITNDVTWAKMTQWKKDLISSHSHVEIVNMINLTKQINQDNHIDAFIEQTTYIEIRQRIDQINQDYYQFCQNNNIKGVSLVALMIQLRKRKFVVGERTFEKHRNNGRLDKTSFCNIADIYLK